jgi:hypothetical protein
MRESLLEDEKDNSGEKLCKICGKRLRPLTKSKDWDTRCYHVTCFRDLIKDIYRFDQVAFKKYGHKKRIGDMYLHEFIKGKNPIIIHFD